MAQFEVATSQLECSQHSTCEECASQIDNDYNCRWCFTSQSCVPSKYMCHPWKTVLDRINCPRDIPNTYNDSFNRNIIAYYIQAANRVPIYSPYEAVIEEALSCLRKTGEKTEILSRVEVPMSIDGNKISYLVAVNRDFGHIVVAVTATNHFTQLMAQTATVFLAMMDEIALGGKVMTYYAQGYQSVINNNFNEKLANAIEKFPDFEILLTGHSLGGAMATILSLHVARSFPNKHVKLCTWSAPRIGDVEFAKLHMENVHESYRVVRDGDFVPDSPMRVSQN
ncbi:unnamed protein product [Caenorhabditis bovis]|uniref:Fungal lipase-type domain-containing protein n=1 Tax=Caenorhabditis bovis TaxID=2654633 RepID=A0A8S1DZQ4_9PELO|nr:unnamed protein product [Caenorhabditis bovis]